MKKSGVNILTTVLCAIIIVSVLGLSVSIFNVDKQTMSTSINSIWSVNIASIEPVNETKTAYDLGAYITDDLIVIKPYLEGPSDELSYIVTVKNNGTYDAVLEKINIDYKKNDLKFELESIKEGDILEKNTFKTFKIVVRYSDEIKDDRIIEPSKIVISLEYTKK